MNDLIKFYFYRLANFLAYPFLKFRGYCLGLESIATEYVKLMKQVCVQDSFNNSFEGTYVLYSLFNGVFFKEDKYNESVLSISKHVNKLGTMEISPRMKLKDVKTFERFCSDLENNYCYTTERWTLYYKNKQISSIVCTLIVNPDYVNHKNCKIDSVKICIFFDCEFNVFSIVKQHFTTILSKHGDETYDSLILKSVIDRNISLDDEFLLIVLAVAHDGSSLYEYFPEYYMDTVYDYSSDDFKQRLELYKMVSY